MLKEFEDGIYEEKGGFWVKVQEIHKDKTPAFCPACQNLLYNIDDKWFFRRGVCSSCAITYLEDRDLPDILNTKEDYLAYVKEKMSIKK